LKLSNIDQPSEEKITIVLLLGTMAASYEIQPFQTSMPSILERIAGPLLAMISPLSRRERLALRQAQKKRQLDVLGHELRQQKLNGEPVGHRRLKTLMLAAGTSRGKTIRLLKELGARPSSRKGEELWTLE